MSEEQELLTISIDDQALIIGSRLQSNEPLPEKVNYSFEVADRNAFGEPLYTISPAFIDLAYLGHFNLDLLPGDYIQGVFNVSGEASNTGMVERVKIVWRSHLYQYPTEALIGYNKCDENGQVTDDTLLIDYPTDPGYYIKLTRFQPIHNISFYVSIKG